MQKVSIQASRSYDILIGSGLLPTLGQEAKKFPKVKTVCIVSETNVFPLHGPAAEKSLQEAGFRVVSFVFPAGEQSKCGEVYLELLNFLAQQQLTRSDLLVALGAAWWVISPALLPPPSCGGEIHPGSHHPAGSG